MIYNRSENRPLISLCQQDDGRTCHEPLRKHHHLWRLCRCPFQQHLRSQRRSASLSESYDRQVDYRTYYQSLHQAWRFENRVAPWRFAAETCLGRPRQSHELPSAPHESSASQEINLHRRIYCLTKTGAFPKKKE